jgi:ABC-type phosphate/phosphonate transport system permease subunit
MRRGEYTSPVLHKAAAEEAKQRTSPRTHRIMLALVILFTLIVLGSFFMNFADFKRAIHGGISSTTTTSKLTTKDTSILIKEALSRGKLLASKLRYEKGDDLTIDAIREAFPLSQKLGYEKGGDLTIEKFPLSEMGR